MAFEHAIALSGGIATGKSTVASLMGLNGIRVIDADKISHEILDSSVQWVREVFGEEYISGEKVDRKKLGSLIFSTPHAKKILEDFLHPLIKERILELSAKQEQLGFAYLIDIPLFFEKGSYDIQESVVVYTPKELQLKRFMKRNGYSREESLRRIESQMDIEEKRRRATYIIDNSGDLKHLQAECEAFVARIKQKYSKS